MNEICIVEIGDTFLSIAGNQENLRKLSELEL